MSETKSDFELVIEPKSTDYDPNDGRWLEQVNQLLGDLQDGGAGTVRKEVTPREGTRGGAEAIILALGSAGAITAAVEMFKFWLARDRSRVIRFKLKTGDKVEEFEASGTGMSAAAIEKVAGIAMERLQSRSPDA